MNLISNPDVKAVFLSYPESVREKMLNLRRLVLEVAEDLGLSDLEEALKWGEPSFLAKKGSTIRMDWKPKDPGQYAMYFKCTSKLVPTFRLVFDEFFNFEGDRAIVFKLDQAIPVFELKQCTKAALRYHEVKQLPILGNLAKN